MSANHLLWIEFRKVEINWLYLVQWDEQFIKLNLTYTVRYNSNTIWHSSPNQGTFIIQ